MRIRHGLIALLASAAVAVPAQAQTLSQYDVFVFQNFRLTTSEVNGNVAIGGNALFTNWRVGHMLTPGYSGYSLVVGNNLTAAEGSVAEGRTYVGGTSSQTNTGYPAAYPPEVGGPSPVNFLAESARLTAISNSYRAMAPNGTTQLVNGELNFIGNQAYNIFEVTMAMLQAGTAGYQFVTPSGSSSIINVTGSSPNSVFNNTAFYFDCTQVANSSSCQTGSNENTPSAAGRTLFNFNEQTDLVFGGPVHGSILAPFAHADFGRGDVVGTVVVRDADALAEFYSNADFVGPVPDVAPVPEPASMVLMATGLVAVAGFARRRRQLSKAV